MSMNLRKLEAQGAKKTKRGKGKHGVYAYLASGKLPSGRSWKKTQAQVSKVREALIKQYGGDDIQPAVLALIESAIEGLMIQRLAGLYVKRAGILRGDSLMKGNLELHSILSGQFISYANLVRLNLESAARLASQKGPDEPALTIAEVIREHDEAKAKAGGNGEGQGDSRSGSAEDGPTLAQDGRSAAGEDEGKDPGGLDSGGNGQGGGNQASVIDGDGRSQDDEGQGQGDGEA